MSRDAPTGPQRDGVGQVAQEELTLDQNIEGKVVVITGASSGLGEATARHLAARGAKLVLGARRIDRLQALAAELRLGAGAAVATDVTDAAQVKALVDGAVAAHGRVDVIVNNAGLMPHSPLERAKEGLRQEVKPYNIRTTIISPGAVQSELPQSVSEADVARGVAEFYEKHAIPADSFARMVAFAISQPDDVDINEILFRPTSQDL